MYIVISGIHERTPTEAEAKTLCELLKTQYPGLTIEVIDSNVEYDNDGQAIIYTGRINPDRAVN